MKIFYKNIYLLIVIVLTGACSKSFVVVSDIPRPLIPSSSMTAHLKYSDEFKNFNYIDPSSKRALEKVQFGTAQVNLFDQIFSSLFNIVDEPAAADLVIEPQVLDFQYSIPAETKSTQYEVWLKYRLKITDGDYSDIADWVVKGYGKTPKSLLVSHLKLFNVASNIALRDVGAQLAIGFNSQPSIKDFIENGTIASKSDGDAEEVADQVILKIGTGSVEQPNEEAVEILDTEPIEAAAEKEVELNGNENQNTDETEFNIIELGAIEKNSLPNQVKILAHKTLYEELQ